MVAEYVSLFFYFCTIFVCHHVSVLSSKWLLLLYNYEISVLVFR